MKAQIIFSLLLGISESQCKRRGNEGGEDEEKIVQTVETLAPPLMHARI